MAALGVPWIIYKWIIAISGPLSWFVLWKWKGKHWFTKGYKKLFGRIRKDEHKEIIRLQAKAIGAMFYFLVWIGIILGEMNIFGVIGGDSTASRNVYIAGGTISMAVFIGGATYLKFLLAGIRLLLERGYGEGNYVVCTHPHRDAFSGWVEELGLFKTKFRAYPKFTVHFPRNSLLLEYRVENYDYPSFHHEIFEFEVPKGKKDLVIGSVPKIDPVSKEVVEPGAESVILQRLRADLPGYLIQTDTDDRKEFEKVFRNMDDAHWSWLSQPSVMLEGDHATLRVPVRSFFDGLILRHQISAKNILEVN